MFGAAIDLATRELLPADDEKAPARRVKRDLGLRLPWLLQQGLLPKDLSELADCIREDGNDAAHQGTLLEDDTQDIHDFTLELLRHLYTAPGRLRLAAERRASRRSEGK
jgi:hypothetical protein